MKNNNNILKINNLNISFNVDKKEIKVLKGIDINLNKGETIAIVGESGSGKSVSMKAVMGLLDDNAQIIDGNIILSKKDEKEIDLSKMHKEKIQKEINGKTISMVFQDPMTALDPTMRVGNQILEGILLHNQITKQEAKKRTLELLNLVGISEPDKCFKLYPHQLSGGMRQRIVIAIALSSNPEILICDEPTTALDVTIQAKILELIKNIQKEMNLSVIIITHNLGVVAKMADYVYVMYNGRIVEKGLTNEIFFQPRHPYTWGLLLSMPDMNLDSNKLYAIPGSPPNMMQNDVGDSFAPRNKYALNIDYIECPPFFKITDTHYAATWLLDERAPKVEIPKELKRKIDIELKEAEMLNGK